MLGRPAVQTTNDYLFVDPAADFKDGKDSKGNKRKPKTDSNGNRKVRKPV